MTEVNRKDMSKKRFGAHTPIPVVEEEKSDCGPTCPHCGSDKVTGISRVVGYFSVIENWNDSKKAELKRRQKGNYWGEETDPYTIGYNRATGGRKFSEWVFLGMLEQDMKTPEEFLLEMEVIES